VPTSEGVSVWTRPHYRLYTLCLSAEVLPVSHVLLLGSTLSIVSTKMAVKMAVNFNLLSNFFTNMTSAAPCNVNTALD
jgi:hypothetical protein